MWYNFQAEDEPEDDEGGDDSDSESKAEETKSEDSEETSEKDATAHVCYHNITWEISLIHNFVVFLELWLKLRDLVLQDEL